MSTPTWRLRGPCPSPGRRGSSTPGSSRPRSRCRSGQVGEDKGALEGEKTDLDGLRRAGRRRLLDAEGDVGDGKSPLMPNVAGRTRAGSGCRRAGHRIARDRVAARDRLAVGLGDRRAACVDLVRVAAFGSVLLVGGCGLALKVRSPIVTALPAPPWACRQAACSVATLSKAKVASAPPRLRRVSGFVVLVPEVWSPGC